MAGGQQGSPAKSAGLDKVQVSTHLIVAVCGCVCRDQNDDWGKNKQTDFWICGRILLNMWRLVRSEVKLGDYRLETVVEHLLGARLPLLTQTVRQITQRA